MEDKKNAFLGKNFNTIALYVLFIFLLISIPVALPFSYNIYNETKQNKNDEFEILSNIYNQLKVLSYFTNDSDFSVEILKKGTENKFPGNNITIIETSYNIPERENFSNKFVEREEKNELCKKENIIQNIKRDDLFSCILFENENFTVLLKKNSKRKILIDYTNSFENYINLFVSSILEETEKLINIKQKAEN